MPEEYHERFPQYVDLVNAVFHASDTIPDSTAKQLLDTDAGVRTTELVVSSESRATPRLGRFELHEQVGHGAFGEVYRARDPQLDREVALKVPRAGVLVGEQDVQRFLREARASAQLRHPHIVPVYEAGQIEGTHYIASDFIRGTTLASRIDSGWRPSCRETATLIAKLASALHFAHTKGIIHRDVKPGNVMLDATGEPLIMDFGLARRQEPDVLQTQEGIRMGTPAYMSPEQAEGRSHLADARSDLWSLGVILYELLSGVRPFQGGVTEIIHCISTQEPAPLQTHNRSISRDLETICLKCLAKAPDGRYASVQHLADDLHRWLNHQPILARRTNSFVRLAKWGRRNPLAASALAVTVMALTALAIYWETRPAYWDVSVRPTGAKVTLDGEPVDTKNGRALLRSTSGRHRVEVTAADYLPQSLDVVLQRGRNNSLLTNVDLRSVNGYLEVNSNPQRATVQVVTPQGRIVSEGSTPFRSRAIRAGLYRIRLRQDMYKPVELSVVVPDGLQTMVVGTQPLELAEKESKGYRWMKRVKSALEETGKSSNKGPTSDFEFVDTPLSEVIDQLNAAFEIDIFLDTSALHDSGIQSDSRITLKAAGMPLGSLLQRALTQVDLTYFPAEGPSGQIILTVTTHEGAERSLIPILHPVGDLTRGPIPMDGDTLIGEIYRIRPASWSQVGGLGTIRYLESSGALSITQTMQAHLEIDEYLQSLRFRRASNKS